MKHLSPNNQSSDDCLTEDFLRLLLANHKRIYAFILTLIHNCTDADDIMQETTTVMWRKFKDYREGTDFVAWSITIAKYRVLSFRKKQAGSRVQFSDEAVEALENETAGMLTKMDHRLEVLQSCLAKLAERDKRLVHMRYEQDAAPNTIAEHIGKSVHSVYKRLAKIHDMLLQCIRRTLAAEETA